MKLIYLWIENYGCFENVEITFDNQYRVELNVENRSINYRKKEDFVGSLEFWGQSIKSINALVGDNGAGKTTLLELISMLMSGGYSKSFGEIVFIAEDPSEKLPILFHSWDECIFDKSTYSAYYQLEENHFVKCKKYDENKVIIINNHIGISDYFTSLRKPVDLRKGNLIRSDYGENSDQKLISTDDNILVNYRKEDFNRQLDFILNFYNTSMETKGFIKIPGSIQISFEMDSYWQNRIYDRVTEKDKNVDKKFKINYREFWGLLRASAENHESEKTKWVKHLKLRVFENLLNYLLFEAHTGQDYTTRRDRFKEMIDSRINEYDLSYDVDTIADDFVEILRREEEVYIKRYEDLLTFINSRDFDQFVSRGNMEIRKIKMDISDDKFNQIYNDLKKFYNLYASIMLYGNFMTFSWGLSTGEHNLLSFFSDLYSKREMISNTTIGKVKCNSLLLLIDEMDLSYHPTVQIQLVSHLVDVLPEIFGAVSIQVILTTHSPLLLTDIPSNSITYLKEGKVYDVESFQTFGQNVYDLFKQSFFVKQMMGKYAKRKIDEVVSFIDKIEVDTKGDFQVTDASYAELNKYEKTINLIGDDLLREQLSIKLDKIKTDYFMSQTQSENSDVKEYYMNLSINEKEELVKLILNDDIV